EHTSAPLIRVAMEHAMRLMGQHFVMAESIDNALARAKENDKKGYLYSYDMLGEAARTEDDANRYFAACQQAVHTIGTQATCRDPKINPGISVKLSALHPRYEIAQQDTAFPILVERLLALTLRAQFYGMHLTVDAEEAERLDLSLDIIEAVFADPAL